LAYLFYVKVKLQLAQALSSQLNRGYQALSSPYSRVEYILQRNNVPVSETDTLEDAAFLSEIMDAREALEDADVDGISEIEKENQSMLS
jgi:molecular chaperone HscB